MASKKKTWFALLGLLSWQPLSGYDIKKMIEIALSYFWSESYGQLYPTLNRLVDEELAVREESARGNRVRHVYRITKKGKEAFEAWLHEPAEMPAIRNELQLKFFLTSRMDPSESIRVIESPVDCPPLREDRAYGHAGGAELLNEVRDGLVV